MIGFIDTYTHHLKLQAITALSLFPNFTVHYIKSTSKNRSSSKSKRDHRVKIPQFGRPVVFVNCTYVLRLKNEKIALEQFIL
jgi:hypothetical protein